MAARTGRVIVAGVALAALVATPARAFDYPNNRLVDPGAENGLNGWQGAGFGVARYDTDGIPRHPAPWTTPSQTDAGAQLFSAAGEAAIWQVADLRDLASGIDAGTQPLSFGALLGGRAQQRGGARLLIQPLDGNGAALGSSLIVGPPSERDRVSQTGLLNCDGSTTAPLGTRAVLVRVETVYGGGLADSVYLLPDRLVQPVSGPRPAEGPGCRTEGTLAGSTQTISPPALRSLIVLPAANRCRKHWPLRFRVRPRWRSEVKRFRVTARGKRSTAAPDQAINVPPPQRDSLRVSLRVTLNDGRIQHGQQRFSTCRQLSRAAESRPSDGR